MPLMRALHVKLIPHRSDCVWHFTNSLRISSVPEIYTRLPKLRRLRLKRPIPSDKLWCVHSQLVRLSVHVRKGSLNYRISLTLPTHEGQNVTIRCDSLFHTFQRVLGPCYSVRATTRQYYANRR